MTVTFQVGDREFGGSGNLEIDFWVCFGGVKASAIMAIRVGRGRRYSGMALDNGALLNHDDWG